MSILEPLNVLSTISLANTLIDIINDLEVEKSLFDRKVREFNRTILTSVCDIKYQIPLYIFSKIILINLVNNDLVKFIKDKEEDILSSYKTCIHFISELFTHMNILVDNIRQINEEFMLNIMEFKISRNIKNIIKNPENIPYLKVAIPDFKNINSEQDFLSLTKEKVNLEMKTCIKSILQVFNKYKNNPVFQEWYKLTEYLENFNKLSKRIKIYMESNQNA